MSGTIRVSDTLTVTAAAGHDPAVIISRIEGGLVRIEVGELRALTAALVEVAGRLGVEDLDNRQGSVVKLASPLPCGITGGGDVACGRPSLAAYLDPDPERPGQWCLTPVCKVHAAAMAALYAQGGDPTGGQPIGRPPGDDAPQWLDVFVRDRDPLARRYIAQLQGPDSTRWEDALYFDDPEAAARFCRLAVETNPNVSAGRVFDQETGQGGTRCGPGVDQVGDKAQGDAGK